MTADLIILDMRTMAFASSVSGFLMAAMMLGIYLAGMRGRAMLDWLVAGLAFGTGYLVDTLSQILVLPVPEGFGISFAYGLIATGHAFVLIGVQRYLGKPARVGLLSGTVLLLFLAGIVFDELRESPRQRVLTFSLLHLSFSAWAGVLLWRSRRAGMRAFHRVAAIVLLGFAVVLAYRFLCALLPEVPLFAVSQGVIQTVAFLAAMVLGFLLTMAFTVMMFREKQVELADLAERDPLTGMNNRLSLDAISDRHMQRAERHGMPLSVMLFDLDFFKRVNDEFGHLVGDQVLSEVAGRINQVIRGEDVAFRFGGEEFLALLPGASLEQAERVAERLRRVIGEEPLTIGGHRLKLTASFGVVQYMPGRESWDGCIKRADQALYRAKRGGRDCISHHAPVSITKPA